MDQTHSLISFNSKSETGMLRKNPWFLQAKEELSILQSETTLHSLPLALISFLLIHIINDSFCSEWILIVFQHEKRWRKVNRWWRKVNGWWRKVNRWWRKVHLVAYCSWLPRHGSITVYSSTILLATMEVICFSIQQLPSARLSLLTVIHSQIQHCE